MAVTLGSTVPMSNLQFRRTGDGEQRNLCFVFNSLVAAVCGITSQQLNIRRLYPVVAGGPTRADIDLTATRMEQRRQVCVELGLGAIREFGADRMAAAIAVVFKYLMLFGFPLVPPAGDPQVYAHYIARIRRKRFRLMRLFLDRVWAVPPVLIEIWAFGEGQRRRIYLDLPGDPFEAPTVLPPPARNLLREFDAVATSPVRVANPGGYDVQHGTEEFPYIIDDDSDHDDVDGQL